jgi:hypothetical protein
MRQQGDSMAGRFFTHRLLPFSLRELESSEYKGDFDRLLERGGFPEPFLAPSALEADRWRSHYLDGLLSEDVLNTDTIRNLSAVRTLIELLRHRVGGPISYTSLSGDLAVSPPTVIKYINLLEALFIIFRVTPYAHNIARSLLKEPKIYFYDWGLVPAGNGGPRLENLAAVALLKHVSALKDYRGESWGLHYLRSKDGMEADFCLVRDNRITQAVEIKSGDDKIGNGLRYFCRRYNLSGVQAVLNLRQESREGDIALKPLKEYLLDLAL